MAHFMAEGFTYLKFCGCNALQHSRVHSLFALGFPLHTEPGVHSPCPFFHEPFHVLNVLRDCHYHYHYKCFLHTYCPVCGLPLDFEPDNG